MLNYTIIQVILNSRFATKVNFLSQNNLNPLFQRTQLPELQSNCARTTEYLEVAGTHKDQWAELLSKWPVQGSNPWSWCFLAVGQHALTYCTNQSPTALGITVVQASSWKQAGKQWWWFSMITKILPLTYTSLSQDVGNHF